MTDNEISSRLAIAIGWPRVVTAVATKTVLVSESAGMPASWRKFDYRDPAVIWPIYDRYVASVHKSSVRVEEYFCECLGGPIYGSARAGTVHKAIALAVINSHALQQREKQK